MDSQPSQIDEAWFDEYVEFGWADIAAYLLKHARFWVYLVENHLLEEKELP